MSDGRENQLLLAADIGGTKANFSLFSRQTDGSLKRRTLKTYQTALFTSPVTLVEDFLKESTTQHPAAACIGVAGPLVDGIVRGANLPWPVSLKEFQDRFPPTPFTIINDLVALCFAIPLLSADQILPLNTASPERNGNIGLIAAGTGLGEAMIVKDGGHYIPCPSEGGHKDFAARSKTEWRLHNFLSAKYGGRVSVERALSGKGLFDIYLFLRGESKTPEPRWLAEEIAAGEPAAAISRNALEKRDSVCVQALDLLVDIFGAEAGNLALQAVATGGLYIGGGVGPKIAPALTTGKFMTAFRDKGRLHGLLDAIPVYLITDSYAPLRGAAACAAKNVDISRH